MKVKPGKVIPSIVKPGQTGGWTFTIIIQNDEGAEMEFAALGNWKDYPKELMRKVVEEINSNSK